MLIFYCLRKNIGFDSSSFSLKFFYLFISSYLFRSSVLTVFLMFMKMVKVEKTYNPRLVVVLGELGESDPFLLNVRFILTVQKI